MDVDAGFIQRWVTNASELLEQVTESLSRAESEKVRLQEEAETYHQQAISVSAWVIWPCQERLNELSRLSLSFHVLVLT